MNHKTVATANVVLQLDDLFPVRETVYLGPAKCHLQIFANRAGQAYIAATAEYLDIFI